MATRGTRSPRYGATTLTRIATRQPRYSPRPGVAAAWPLYQVDVALAERESFFLQIYGVDLFSSFRTPWSTTPEDLSDAVSELGWLAVTPALAHEMGWAEGDSIQVTSGTRRVDLVIGALVDFQKMSPLASRKLAVMDISQAQGLLGQPGKIHQIQWSTSGVEVTMYVISLLLMEAFL